MKKQLKRLFAMMLALSMSLALLAGCGDTANNTGGNNSNQSGTDQSQPDDSAAGGTTKNSEIYPLDCDKTFTVATRKEDMNEKYCSELWEETTGVDIDWVTWDAEQTKLALSTGELPDAFRYANGIDKDTAYEYGSAGYFVNFMDYIDYMPNFKAAMEKYPEALAMIQNEDGSVYSLPRLGTTATTHNAIYFRADMMREIGWEAPPATTDEFLQYIIECQEHFGADDPEFQAFNGYKSTYMGVGGETTIFGFFFPAFGELMECKMTTTPDGKTVVYGATTEQFKHTIEFMNDIYTSGAFGKDIYTEDGTAARALTLANKVAISPFASYLTGANFESGTIDDLLILEPLTSQYWDKQHFLAKKDYVWDSNLISTSCEDIPAMCRWMDSFYATEENPLNEEGTIWGVSYMWGEYGVDWTRDGDTYAILDHEGYDSASAWLGNEGTGETLGMYDLLMVEKSGTGLEAKARGTLENTYPYREYPGFNLSLLTLSQDDRDTYNDIYTDVNAYITEMSAKFITGEADIDAEWETFVDTLYDMGLQEAIDIYQNALDAYQA